jgi:ABC-2 type transport system permease protein
MNTFTICRRELISYFRSPIAYGVMAFYAVIAGYFYWAAVTIFIRQSLQSTLTGQSVPMSVDDWVIRSVFSNVAVIGLFVVPMIAMRLFAEEKRSGTIELLVTSPLRDLEIIVGKWLAAVVLYAAMLAVSLVSIGLLYMYGKPSWKGILIGYLGLLLQGCAMLAVAAFISSCTKNQIIAAAGAFGVLLLLWTIDWTTTLSDTPLMHAVGYLSLSSHNENFSKGLLDAKDAVFYVTMSLFGLFLTARSMESMRWRA